MTEVFADTGFWVALLHPRDKLHGRAKALQASLQSRRIVTSDEVLTEVQNFFSKYGPELRKAATELEAALENNPNVVVLPAQRQRRIRARELYAQRLDKKYSLTDCDSMIAMWDRGITEVLAYDAHFQQEGFVALLRQPGE